MITINVKGSKRIYEKGNASVGIYPNREVRLRIFFGGPRTEPVQQQTAREELMLNRFKAFLKENDFLAEQKQVEVSVSGTYLRSLSSWGGMSVEEEGKGDISIDHLTESTLSGLLAAFKGAGLIDDHEERGLLEELEQIKEAQARKAEAEERPSLGL